MTEGNYKAFFKDYLNALNEGNAVLFAGAGLSKPSDYVDWKELMRDIADELNLSVDKEKEFNSNSSILQQ